MLILILGVALWGLTHSIKRTAPGFRARLGETRAKLFVTGTTIVSIGLMIVGYRIAQPVEIYDLGPDTIYLNNLMMVIALALMFASTTRSHLVELLRHPMNTGFILFCLAHLFISGDIRSILLFGGLGIWAILSIILNNIAEPDWDRPSGTLVGDAILLTIVVALTIGIGWLHTRAGLQPFGA